MGRGDEFAAEAAQRWGDTPQFQESQRRTSRYTDADWARFAQAQSDVERAFVSALQAGLEPTSPEPRAAAERHRALIDQWFYPCSYEMQVGLAEMYLADPRFTAHYDDLAPGLAVYVHDAIIGNALDHL